MDPKIKVRTRPQQKDYHKPCQAKVHKQNMSTGLDWMQLERVFSNITSAYIGAAACCENKAISNLNFFLFYEYFPLKDS